MQSAALAEILCYFFLSHDGLTMKAVSGVGVPRAFSHHVGRQMPHLFFVEATLGETRHMSLGTVEINSSVVSVAKELFTKKKKHGWTA